MEKIINIVDFGILKDSLKHRYCIEKLLQLNPGWKIKIWNEENLTFKTLKKEAELLILDIDKRLVHTIIFEYIILNLMKMFGGFWCESDQIFKIKDDFNENYNYIYKWEIDKMVGYSFTSFTPLFIIKDKKNEEMLDRAIKLLKNDGVKYYGLNEKDVCGEYVHQTFLSVFKYILPNFKNSDNDVLDFFGFENYRVSNGNLIDWYFHLSPCFVHNKWSVLKNNEIVSTALICDINSYSIQDWPLQYLENYKEYVDIEKVDFKTLQKCTYENIMSKIILA